MINKLLSLILAQAPVHAAQPCSRGLEAIRELRQGGIVQVAGIKDADDAKRVLAAGVDWLGFPLRLDVNTPDLTEAEAASLIATFDPKVKSVLITYLNSADEINGFMSALGTDIVQLHGPISIEELRKLRLLRPNALIIKSLVVGIQNEDRLRQDVRDLESFVDAFITDTFDPSTGASGATGRVHDWRISRALVELSSKPVILAGGLNPTNVREAILAVKPAGVDAHTGVEDANGFNDARLTRDFFENAKAAFRELMP